MKVPEHWTFDNKEVAQDFDAHVREQLPWYDLATGAVVHIARHYITEGGLVYDIGASTGNIGRALDDTLAVRGARFVPVERSRAMAAKYHGPGVVVNEPVETLDFKRCDVVICFLVLMFLPPRTRAKAVHNMIEGLHKGGVLIVVDKLEPVGGYASTVLHRLTLAEKLKAGVNPEDILRKELSLSGVQRPMLAKEILHDAVEFFRFGDFVGWFFEKR